VWTGWGIPGRGLDRGAMDLECVVHARARVFSHLRPPGVRRAAEPDVDLPNPTQREALAVNGFWYAVFGYFHCSISRLWKHSLLNLLGPFYERDVLWVCASVFIQELLDEAVLSQARIWSSFE